MSDRPADIPRDIWSAASALVSAHCGCAPGRSRANMSEHSDRCWANVTATAGAILAERERVASALTDLQEELEEARKLERKLQAALMFWMPGVCEATDTGLERSAGDDAFLLAGFDGEEPKTCWGDIILARAESAEAQLAKMREAVSWMNNHEPEIIEAAEKKFGPLDAPAIRSTGE